MSIAKQKTLDLEEEEEKSNVVQNSQSNSEDVWAKLTSISQSGKPEIFVLKDNKVSIGRNSTNTICIPDKRLSGSHCEIERQDNMIALMDLSTNGTFINNEKVGKGKSMSLQNGDLIHLLHHSKVKESETMGYFFTLCKIENLKRKDRTEDETIKKDLEKLKKLDDELGEGMKCVICLDYIYQCVTLIDCLHNFCGACFSDWMKKSKECPSCRNAVKAVKKNPIVNSIITQYLDAHPEKLRSKEEYEEMDQKNKISCDLLELDKSKKKGKKQASAPRRGARRGLRQRLANDDDSDVSYESDDNNNNVAPALARAPLFQPAPLIVCTECTVPRPNDGFKCGRNQIHIYCMSCRQAFPDRAGANYKQKCEICNIAYCNLYFNCKSNRNPKLYEIKDHKLDQYLKADIFRGNQYEYLVFDDYMKGKSMTNKDIFDEINEKYIKKDNFKYLVNKYIVSNPIINMEISIREDTAICTACFFLVWFQMVYLYRKDHHKEMPDEVKKRGSCWYGINCSTMKHNPDHAKKLNHICDQTKF